MTDFKRILEKKSCDRFKDEYSRQIKGLQQSTFKLSH